MEAIDLSYRPTTYWPNAPTIEQLLSRIKGQARRDKARSIMQTDGFPGLSTFLARQKLSDADRAAWGAIHPSLMGGEYLPDVDAGEVEIARISLASTTGDQISIRASRVGESIHYSVVDEYETEFSLPTQQSAEPLTLAELVALLDGTAHPDDQAGGGLIKSHWNFLHNQGESPEEAIDFVRVESGFYPALSLHYAVEADKWLSERMVEKEAEKDQEDT